MEKVFKKMWLLPLFICAIVSCLALTACGDDDKDEPEPEKPEIPSNFDVQSFKLDFVSDAMYSWRIVPLYFIPYMEEEYVWKESNKLCDVAMGAIDYPNFTKVIGFSKDYYSKGGNIRIAKCNNVTKISQIQSLNGLSWIDNSMGDCECIVDQDCLLLCENTGYIIEGSFCGSVYYIRILISHFNRNSSNKIIGIEGEYQQFQPK